ncbi:Toxin HigB [Corynebacterium glaucum]|uniref:Toxin HigB n=1 Tax=Corynebacterium glaucum TaxID=187491 RepID=A0A1Q2HXK6_9CORY|nr:type II toxin-antitoxin system RelE/ParE family toxin [Corynebacterium glaucum]AQQ15564.1 Toxin HigB [Corynebacterium glaucum]
MTRMQVRWFALGGDAMPVSKKELQSLDKQGQAALLEKINRLKRGKSRSGDLRSIRDDIFEIRAQVGNNHYRAMAIQDSPVHIIILSCFYKNTQKTPMMEIDKAVERSKTWKARKE